MTRVFLAAGVAALAIAAPASADPHGGHGGGGGHGPAMQARGGGGGGGGGGHFQMQARGGGGGGGHFAMPRGGGGFAMQRPQGGGRMMRQQGGGRMAARQQGFGRMAAREQVRMNSRGAHAQMAARQQVRMNGRHAQAQMAARQQVRMNGRHAQAQMAARQQIRMNGRHAQAQMAARQQMRMNGRHAQAQMAARQQMHGNRQQAQARMAQQQQMRGNARQLQMANRQQLQANRQQQLQANRVALNTNAQIAANNGRGYGVGGCPPGLAGKGCTPPGIARQQSFAALRSADPQVFQTSGLQLLDPRMQILGPARAAGFIGQPLSTVGNYVPLAALPASVSYLYPDTPAYYYQYGGGYLYQVDRGTSLIDALIPLLAGGFLPGTYLPQTYMSSYVPDYYGLNAFYPASYGPGYGYGYDNLCNRYAYGVVYQVDCMTGMVENVVPMYAGGYGVGQMLPSAYSYYNVPMQYRSLYYPTADYSYWYAPGAIYQYNPSTSLITSVAALMSPGFTVGQPLPAGYDMYNVPMAYRATYYDTPNAWYRYNNGYIYQVDPATMLVTSVVASLLS